MTNEEVVGTLVSGSKQIESILDEKFGAQGKGLHSKALSIQGHLGAALLKKIQYVATIRNKAVHEHSFQDIPIKDWTRAKDQVLAALDALDPPEAGSMAPVHPGPRAHRAGGVIGFMVLVAIALVVVASAAMRGAAGSSSPPATPSAAASGDGQPAPVTELWSIEHPAHATQAFPWREEQAAFIAAGEKGALPNETMWRVISAAHQVKRKGGQYLELEIQLGGGKTTAKVLFGTRDAFGRPGTEANSFEVELSTKKVAVASLEGTALKSDGHLFGGLSDRRPFECNREVQGGCGDWTDQGVSYFALSSVSYGNALKIVDAR
jgi:hypothetical protein